MPSEFWMLTAEDASRNPLGLPAEWPIEFSVKPQRSPWIGPLTRDGIADYKAARSTSQPSKTRQQQWDKWRTDNPPRVDPTPGPTVVSPDGQRWEITITNSGTIGKRKV